MSLRDRLVLPVILSALAVLAGCGSNPTAVPPPTGGFSDTNLSGTYVFSVTGTDSLGGALMIVGTFIANGKGAVSAGGVIDVNGTDTGPILGQNVTGGSYSVGADGRAKSQGGVLTLQTDTGNTYGFDFVLSSSEHGLITEFDNNGSGSGTLDLQANVTQANINLQSYAFNFTGSSGVGTVICNFNFGGNAVIPYAAAGAFTLDANGLATGIEDFNDNCSSAGGTSGLPITSGSSVSLASSPGTAILTVNSVSYNFAVFPISATHLKFIEVDTNPIVSGDAYTQTASVSSGNNIFSLAGFDMSLAGPFATAGIMNTDGNGNITQTSVQDIGDLGTAGEITTGITGTYSPLTGGRAVLTFTGGFVNGNGGLACANCQFAAYPSSGGLLLLEIDNGGITDGAAYLQGNSPALVSGQGYGMNLTGFNLSIGTQEDDIVEFTDTSGSFSPGIIDANDAGSLSYGNKFTSTYTADSSVTGRGTVTPGDNSYLLTVYSVDAATSVVVSTDPNLVGLGTIVEQNASAKANAAEAHLAILRSGANAHKDLKKRN